ncbi:hypothetical protein [Oceanicola sp. 502str15]|uniref:hypothetical protein n=1 Tax=Oceanicola sp. 502str15 TaxID=2696061 RepID=UPI002094DBAC|nr:hypothetical protein [Oceanicola sp. 502str15]MCO6381730.1 hypothetical protein [Oceanicola sp. 502str15]
MSRYLTRSTRALVTGFGIAILAAGSASAQKCTAGSASGMGSAAELCGCSVVTKGFLRAVSRKDNFGGLLSSVQSTCPKLGVLLTDLPTAAATPTIRNPPSGRAEVTTAAAAVEEEEPWDDGCYYNDYNKDKVAVRQE